jgi:GPH family glycoside/pentoside/hexuronide:cation symporter
VNDVAKDRLTLRTLLAYAAPGLALAIPTLPVYVHLPYLYGDLLGIGLAATGMILLSARAFDMVSDPAIGYLSDRVATRWGRRKPWILAGAPIAAVALVMLLDPPDGAGAGYLLWCLLALYAGWTLIAVPYTAWGAELSGSYHERTRITSLREGAGILGILIAVGIPALALANGMDLPGALSLIAWVTVVAGGAALCWAMYDVPDRPGEMLPPVPLGTLLITAGRSLRDNGPFRRLIAAWLVNGFSNGVPAVLFLFFLQHVLGVGEAGQGAFMLAYFLSAILAVPVWMRLSGRWGKHRVWSTSMLASCLMFAGVPFIDAGNAWLFFIVCVVTGAALGADLALPPSMQADVVDYGNWRFPGADAGLLFAFWSMATKGAQALAAGVALPLVSVLGFDPAVPNDQGRLALAAVYAWLPLAFKIFAIALVWRFPITARRQRAIRQRLARRAAEAA